MSTNCEVFDCDLILNIRFELYPKLTLLKQADKSKSSDHESNSAAEEVEAPDFSPKPAQTSVKTISIIPAFLNCKNDNDKSPQKKSDRHYLRYS